MRKRMPAGMQRCVIGLMLVSLLVTGCKSGARATKAPESAPTATEVLAAESASAVSSGVRALDNLIQLAPIRITSSYVYKKGTQETSKARLEADLDAKGNEHLFLYDQNDQQVELYLVDGRLFIRGGEDQFMVLSDMPKDSAFAFLAVYGGAYLLAYNNIEDARKVASESVNGFQTDKYEINFNLDELGVPGLAASAQGAQFDYQGFAWLERKTQALIRAQVDWTTKGSTSDAIEAFHAEFQATRGSAIEIVPPANVSEPTAFPPQPGVEEPTATPEPGAGVEPTATLVPTEPPMGEPTATTEPSPYPGF